MYQPFPFTFLYSLVKITYWTFLLFTVSYKMNLFYQKYSFTVLVFLTFGTINFFVKDLF